MNLLKKLNYLLNKASASKAGKIPKPTKKEEKNCFYNIITIYVPYSLLKIPLVYIV